MPDSDCYELASPLIRSTVDALSTMLNMSVVAGAPTCVPPAGGANLIHAELTFTGDYSARIFFSLSTDTARRLASALTGGAMPISKDDLADACAEFANIVAGGAKARLRGQRITMSFPEISFGQWPAAFDSTGSLPIFIHCSSEIGDIAMTLINQARLATLRRGPQLRWSEAI